MIALFFALTQVAANHPGLPLLMLHLLNNTCGFTDLRLAKFISESEKIDQTKISLNHYFINLYNNNESTLTY